MTRMVTRHITVNSESEANAQQKAIEKYYELEMALPNASDAGSPQVDSIEKFP